MARRGYQSEELEVREGEVVTPAEVVVPLTEQQIALNELDAYYGKVLGDLNREMQEAHAVHDASEKRMAAIEAQKAQIDAEYAERKTAIEGEPPPPPEIPLSRWAAPSRPPKPTPLPA
jgi:hypothetical protein